MIARDLLFLWPIEGTVEGIQGGGPLSSSHGNTRCTWQSGTHLFDED
jgi:hypothetical protein